ncbi:hypothetical protein PsYK624_130020 [Phanerochaete sordida]|uniref:Ricin B lectin domain-containing protein n=1 Tax=Phanerochaete sordida TaxID=48140 RepID=A0A9P3GL80_9APHY|nr:hypothetical protein PsYK624_130020 [Phanerochaete sordida]
MSGSRRPRASTSLSTWPLVESPMFSTSGSAGPGAVDGQSPAAVIASVSTAALNSLQDLLDAANTLPCIKYVASVAVKILQTIDQMKTTERELQLIGLRARNIVIAVSDACKGAGPSLDAQLQNDLTQLTNTMHDILKYIQDLSSRSKVKKVFYKTQDATAVRSLDNELVHAFQLFSVQSNVSLRVTQVQMFDMLKSMSIAETQPALGIKDVRLDVPEGLYMIRVGSSMECIECEHIKSSPTFVHAYVAPFGKSINPYQLWTIYSRRGLDFRYTIRNFATGSVLDRQMGDDGGNQVVCWSSRGGDTQTWEFMGSRQSETTDYFYIRGCNSHIVLDGKCPSGSACNYLHITEESPDGPSKRQEWCLIRIPWTSVLPFPSQTPTPPVNPTGNDLPRRQFLLQNVASGGYAAAIGLMDKEDTPNVIISTSAAEATRWYLLHQGAEPEARATAPAAREDLFALVARSDRRLATLDYYYLRHIQAVYRRFGPQDPAHAWRVLPAASAGAFVFSNRKTGELLCQAQMAGPLATASADQARHEACQWRLVDAATMEVCRVLYDSSLTILPPKLAGAPGPPMPVPAPAVGVQKFLRTKVVSGEDQRQFVESLRHEHEVMDDMLFKSGYTSLVVAPQLIRGWKDGKVHEVSVVVRDEEDALGVQRFRGKGMYNFNKCERRS